MPRQLDDRVVDRGDCTRDDTPRQFASPYGPSALQFNQLLQLPTHKKPI